jgi:hypothetical protein
VLYSSGQAIAAAFDRAVVPELLPPYNIAPSQLIAVVRASPGMAMGRVRGKGNRPSSESASRPDPGWGRRWLVQHLPRLDLERGQFLNELRGLLDRVQTFLATVE